MTSQDVIYDAIIVGAGMETSYGNAGIIESSYVLPFAPPDFSKIPHVFLGKMTAARVNYPSGLKHLPWMARLYFNSISKQGQKNGRLMRPLLENAVAEHSALIKGTPAEKYQVSTGRIELYRREKEFLSGQFERDVMRDMEVAFQVLDQAQLQELEPAIKPVFQKGIIWPNSARYTNPGKVVEGLAHKFQQNAGVFCMGQVTALDRGENDVWYVQTQEQAEYKARNVVICTGPWANDLLRPLGCKMPIAMKRGYHQHFNLKGGVTLSHALVDVDKGYLLAPMEDGIRLTTGAEFADRDAPPNLKQIAMALPHARQVLDLGNAVEPTPWMGSRPCTADSLPIIGRATQHSGLWLNLGHGHVGMTVGPTTGRLVAQMMLGEKPFCDPSPYSPQRF